MAKPTITYNHALLDDLTSTTNWAETESGLDATASILNKTYLKISGTCDNVGDEYAYYEKDFTNFSTDNYPYYLIRYATEVASAGLAISVEAVFTSGTQQLLEPSFSTTWKVQTGTLTAGKTLDKLRIYADDVPNTIASGTFYVLCDFVLVCEGAYTIPSISREEMVLINTDSAIRPPGRLGGISQYMGADSPRLEWAGEMKGDVTDWGTPLGEKLLNIWFNRHQEPWQWVTSDLINSKMKMDDLRIRKDKTSGALRVWDASLSKYDGTSGANEWVWDYFLGQMAT